MKEDFPERDRFYLLHMLECISDIGSYCRTGDIEHDHRTLDAVLRKLQILTESSMRISAELKAAHSEVGWREMAGFRNVVVHDYLGIRVDRIILIVNNDLPKLKDQLQQIVRTLDEQPG